MMKLWFGSLLSGKTLPPEQSITCKNWGSYECKCKSNVPAVTLSTSLCSRGLNKQLLLVSMLALTDLSSGSGRSSSVVNVSEQRSSERLLLKSRKGSFQLPVL